jgi:large subunit ribosomal protein L1
MVKQGKKYLETAKLVEDRAYQPGEAVELVKKTTRAKFDETVELHLRRVSTRATPPSR